MIDGGGGHRSDGPPGPDTPLTVVGDSTGGAVTDAGGSRPIERIVVEAGPPLSGEIPIDGAKNSVLKLMAATLLCEGNYRISHVPRIADVDLMAELLRIIGCDVNWSAVEASTLHIAVPAQINPVAPYDIVDKFRASIAVLGPMLARCGEAKVARPGGDDLGSRPIDIHLWGVEKLGAKVQSAHGYVEAFAGPAPLTGTTMVLDRPSVGATENILMAAVGAKGTTVIDSAAREPEIVDLCNFLVAMGADISGVGTATLTVSGPGGTGHLHPVDHQPIPDRIEAGTYLMAAGITGGEITLTNARADHMTKLCDLLERMGMLILAGEDTISVVSPHRLRAEGSYITLPYPGLATDYQPMLVALLATAKGKSIITENVFEARFRYVDELWRMNADIRVDHHHLVVQGIERLSGAKVRAHDIRAGAALAIAGLHAEGVTEVTDAHHVARGYEDLAGKLSAVGARIRAE